MAKCLYCGKEFSPDTEPYQKPRVNRYAHESCCTWDNDEYVKDRIKLYLREKFGDSYSGPKITRQLDKFEKEGMKPRQIYSAIVYWFEVKHGDISKAMGGIGIIPHIYQESIEYYAKQAQIKDNLRQTSKEDYVKEDRTTVFKPKPIQKPKGIRLFDLQ